VTPDKRLIAAAGNPHIKLFDLTSNHASAIFDYNGHSSNVTALGFQREQKWMYSASEDCTVKVWDLRAPGAQRDFQREFKDKTLVNCLVLHPCQVELVAGYQSGQVCVLIVRPRHESASERCLALWTVRRCACGI
jgi:G protein beta subunit-like protein